MQSTQQGQQEQQKVEEEPTKLILIDEVKELANDIVDYEPTFPLKTTKNILKSVGFQSSDENTYKLINAMTEQFANDIITSVISLKSNKIKNLEKNILKKKGGFTFTLEDLLGELKVNQKLCNLFVKERGINIFKTKYFIGSELNDKFVDTMIKQEKLD